MKGPPVTCLALYLTAIPAWPPALLPGCRRRAGADYGKLAARNHGGATGLGRLS